MKLTEIRPGEKFKISTITVGKEVGKRLADMGFVRGTEGKVIRVALAGDPIEVTILNYHVSIRKSEANDIEVIRISEKVKQPAKIES